MDDDVGSLIPCPYCSIGRVFFKGTTDRWKTSKWYATKFDLLILDFLMMPIHGDQVVERIRKFNKELYILC